MFKRYTYRQHLTIQTDRPPMSTTERIRDNAEKQAVHLSMTTAPYMHTEAQH